MGTLNKDLAFEEAIEMYHIFNNLDDTISNLEDELDKASQVDTLNIGVVNYINSLVEELIKLYNIKNVHNKLILDCTSNIQLPF